MNSANPSLARKLLPDLAVTAQIIRGLENSPAEPALHYGDACISNAALLQKVQRLAACLREHGIGRHDRVAVGMTRCPELVVTLLALWDCGAVYIPLDPALPRERLLNMCSVAAPDCLITQPGLDAVLGTLPLTLLKLDSMDFAEPQLPPPPDYSQAEVTCNAAAAMAGALDDPAYILFTSGSTGLPKGVLISQRNLLGLFRGILALLQLRKGQRVLACASFSFDIALFELLAPLLCGGSIVLADDETSHNPELLAKLINDKQADVVQATPSLWQLLVRQHWNPRHRAVLAIATGEALPRTLARAILADTPVLWNLYGPTECTLWASAHRVTAIDINEAAPAFVSIGTAVPGYELHLQETDANAALQPGAECGQLSQVQQSRSYAATQMNPQCASELWIGGAGVGGGYCGEPELSAAAFVSAPCNRQRAAENAVPTSIRESALQQHMHWYRSGDLAWRDSKGNFHCAGRLDAQVKVNGYRIEPDEIALLLRQHASIREAVCLAKVLPEPRGTLLFACVVFIPGMPNKNRHSLNQYLARHLPNWMLPQRYYFLERLPLTTHGKLDRASLLALTEFAPRPLLASGSLHDSVARIFCEVLDIDTIGPCDSFLDAGGSSMLGATLVMLVNQRFATHISLRQALATPPTVQSMVRLLQATAGTPAVLT